MLCWDYCQWYHTAIFYESRTWNRIMIKVTIFSAEAASQSASIHQSEGSVLKKTQMDSQRNLRCYWITHFHDSWKCYLTYFSVWSQQRSNRDTICLHFYVTCQFSKLCRSINQSQCSSVNYNTKCKSLNSNEYFYYTNSRTSEDHYLINWYNNCTQIRDQWFITFYNTWSVLTYFKQIKSF